LPKHSVEIDGRHGQGEFAGRVFSPAYLGPSDDGPRLCRGLLESAIPEVLLSRRDEHRQDGAFSTGREHQIQRRIESRRLIGHAGLSGQYAVVDLPLLDE
jgi:hypothetical protein